MASELPDGIKITGTPVNQLHGATISCHDDHRIAMSFAVLGCLVPGIVISDKACVEKTYPEFWDDLERILKVGLKIPEEQVKIEKAANSKTIVLIGSSPFLLLFFLFDGSNRQQKKNKTKKQSTKV